MQMTMIWTSPTQRFTKACLILTIIVLAMTVINSALLSFIPIANPAVLRLFTKTTLLLSWASIVAGVLALFIDSPKRYAAICLLLSILLLGTAGFLSEGDPTIRYPGPPTQIPGPSHFGPLVVS